jgi:hypothetical protein
VTKSWFPDLFGPSTVSANSAAAVSIRKKVLNVLSPGVTAVDNPTARRLDMTVPNPAWSQVDMPTSAVGEWLPANTAFVAADMVRVTSSTSGTLMTGLDSTSDPTRLVKYVANYGSNTISLQPPVSPISGKQYFTGPAFALTANTTVRVVWDSVSLVYRVRGTAPVVSSAVVLDGSPLDLDSSHLSNPS